MFTIVEGSIPNRLGNMEVRVLLPTQWASQNIIEQPFPTSILMSDVKAIEVVTPGLLNPGLKFLILD